MKTINQIPSGYSVVDVGLKGYEPYALGCSKDGLKEERFAIPYALGYFLITHWAGTPELKADHRREMANEIKKILNL